MPPNQTLHILVASGVNLDLLGKREPKIYGAESLTDIHKKLMDDVKTYTNLSIQLELFQTNSEPKYLEKLSEQSWDGCVLNPGAWTHTSLALADRLKALDLLYVEVHCSNIYARESYRHHSYISSNAVGTICGFGSESYRLGLAGLISKIRL